MKKITLLASILCMLTYILNAQDNRALQITNDGTWFVVEGLDESVNVLNCTLECWVKLDAEAEITDYTGLIDFRDAGDANAKAVVLRNTGGIGYEWHEQWGYAGTDPLELDEWHHVAVVVSGDDILASIYVDGELVGTDDTYTTLGSELALGVSLRIGGSANLADRTLIGMIDEVRVWTVARTEDEINDNMNIQIDPASEDLYLYYRFNEEDGSESVLDETGEGYDLLVVEGFSDYEFVDDTPFEVVPESILDTKASLTISTYPNPVTNQLHFKGLNIQTASVKIYDIAGNLLEESLINSSYIDVAKYQTGIYFIEIKEGNNLYNGKFIKE